MVLERLQLNLVSLAEKSTRVTPNIYPVINSLFSGFDVEWKSSSVKAELVSRLDKNSFSEPLCLDVQWNCTGTLLAGAYVHLSYPRRWVGGNYFGHLRMLVLRNLSVYLIRRADQKVLDWLSAQTNFLSSMFESSISCEEKKSKCLEMLRWKEWMIKVLTSD